jgi:RNA polymerase sigma-70 factor (ECF subfamily)
MDSVPALAQNLPVLAVVTPILPVAEPEAGCLLTRAQQGDNDAYGALCRLYEVRIYRHALMLCRDPVLAEDLAQETLLEGWKSLRRYNGKCQFFTWLTAILLNHYRKQLRKKFPVDFSNLPDGTRVDPRHNQLVDSGILPDQVSEQSERAAWLRECIDRLPTKQREVIYLRFYVDNSLEAIAIALHCSLGTVKSRLFNALERLRKMPSPDSPAPADRIRRPVPGPPLAPPDQ